MDAYQVAMGFIQVANEAMCRPIRALTQVSDWTSKVFTVRSIVMCTDIYIYIYIYIYIQIYISSLYLTERLCYELNNLTEGLYEVAI